MAGHSEHIFSLDIGTRSVVGMILKQEGDSFSIVDYESVEHQERSMFDGQIHDVSEVAKIIQQVKNRLAERNGSLKQVSVAAAGRSLKTKKATFEQPVSSYALLTKNDVLGLEFAAIQEAQKQLAKNQSEVDYRDYYCVGYSVVHYYLDGEMIGNLIDQRGHMAKVEVIATFLPRLVVDSLMTALNKAELQMRTLTLEPIAAIHVLIPSTMRKLNIALIDIGAGTSDIAITANGTISAYGMVPVAGDEITEALSQAFLLDFHDAEQMKRKLLVDEEVGYTDILGMEYVETSTNLIAQIDDAIEALANQISQKIWELNGAAPQAVMLIGGGSLTPVLPEKLAQKLQLPPSRVAVRGTEAIRNLSQNDNLKGPEFVTPIGIAVAAQHHPIKYLTVSLNNEEVRMFDLKRIQVGDVLLHAGWDIKKIKGRPGMAISIEVNGKVKFIPGTLGTPPVIRVNELPAHFDTTISDQDVINIEPGIPGEEPTVLIKDLLSDTGSLDVYVEGVLHSLAPLAMKNGVHCDMTDEVNDRDVIEIRLPRTVEEVLKLTHHEEEIKTTELHLIVNGEPKKVKYARTQVLLNDRMVDLTQTIRHGDALKLVPSPIEVPTVQSVVTKEIPQTPTISVTFNGEPVSIPIMQTEIFVNGKQSSWDQRVEHGDVVDIKTENRIQPVFSDVFRYSTTDLKRPAGAIQMKTLINGRVADFQTELHDGDKVELRWEYEMTETLEA